MIDFYDGATRHIKIPVTPINENTFADDLRLKIRVTPINENTFADFADDLQQSQQSFVFKIIEQRDQNKVFKFANAIVDNNSKRETLKDFVYKFEQLKKNWDGHGGLPISKAVIKHICNLIDIIKNFLSSLPNPEITPLSNGTVSIEWETASGVAYLEVGNTRYSGFIKIGHEKSVLLKGKSDLMDQTILVPVYANLFSKDFSSQPVTNIIYSVLEEKNN